MVFAVPPSTTSSPPWATGLNRSRLNVSGRSCPFDINPVMPTRYPAIPPGRSRSAVVDSKFQNSVWPAARTVCWPLFGSYGKASIVSGTLSPSRSVLLTLPEPSPGSRILIDPFVDKTGNEQGSKERIVGRRREYIDRSAHSETVLLRDNAGVGNTVAIRIGQLDPDHALRAVPDREDVAGDRAAEGSGKGVFRQPVSGFARQSERTVLCALREKECLAEVLE